MNSDTFTGAYAAEYVRQQRCEKGWDIKSAVRRACAAGALTVMQAGAQDGIPWADEIDAFMEQHEASQALDETDDVTRLDVPQDPKL
jgi:sugar/nucleoside kinase (ribokinase family)